MTYYRVSQTAGFPKTLDQLIENAGKHFKAYVTIFEQEEPPTSTTYGTGLFRLEDGGALTFIVGNYDSSD